MDVHLHSESVVDQRTGEVSAPSEYVDNLRALEREVSRCDDALAELKASTKIAREAREKAIAQLRSAIREGKVLPLLERAEDEEDENEEGGAGDALEK